MTPSGATAGVEAELAAIARRTIWFEPPETALADRPRFLAYAFRYASAEDMTTLRATLGDDALRYALDCAPPGIIDARSWAYWNLMLGRWPVEEQQNRMPH